MTQTGNCAVARAERQKVVSEAGSRHRLLFTSASLPAPLGNPHKEVLQGIIRTVPSSRFFYCCSSDAWPSIVNFFHVSSTTRHKPKELYEAEDKKKRDEVEAKRKRVSTI